MIYFRSIMFYIGEALSTIPFFIVSILALPLNPKARAQVISGWARFVVWWLKITCKLTYNVVGKNNIPNTPCVFAANHQSTWETIATQAFLPPLAYVLKKELFKIPVFGWGLWATKPIAIDRSDKMLARDQVTKQGIQKLAEGRFVLIFPEGTRTSYGDARNFKRGGATLARNAQVDIVPIAHNAGKFWQRDSWWINPGTIQCNIGPKISVKGKSDSEVMTEVKDWIVAQNL